MKEIQIQMKFNKVAAAFLTFALSSTVPALANDNSSIKINYCKTIYSSRFPSFYTVHIKYVNTSQKTIDKIKFYVSGENYNDNNYSLYIHDVGTFSPNTIIDHLFPVQTLIIKPSSDILPSLCTVESVHFVNGTL
jgi:hypothetical protein